MNMKTGKQQDEQHMGIRVGFGAAAEKAEEQAQVALWQAPVVAETIRGLENCMGFLGVPPIAINHDCYKVLSRHGALEPLDVAVHLTWDVYDNSPPERILGEVPAEVAQALAYIRNIESSDHRDQAMKTALLSRNPVVVKFLVGAFCAEYEEGNFEAEDGRLEVLETACTVLSGERIWQKTPTSLLLTFAGHLQEMSEGLNDREAGYELSMQARIMKAVTRLYQREDENIAAADVMEQRLENLKRAVRPKLRME